MKMHNISRKKSKTSQVFKPIFHSKDCKAMISNYQVVLRAHHGSMHLFCAFPFKIHVNTRQVPSVVQCTIVCVCIYSYLLQFQHLHVFASDQKRRFNVKITFFSYLIFWFFKLNIDAVSLINIFIWKKNNIF